MDANKAQQQREALRQSIRCANDAWPESLNAEIDLLIYATLRARSGLPYCRNIGPLRKLRRSLGSATLRYIAKSLDPNSDAPYLVSLTAKADEQRGFPSPQEMRQQLEHLEFGVTVLRHMEAGLGKGEAMARAWDDSGRQPISDRALRDRFGKFEHLVRDRWGGVIPHLEYDSELGQLAPTRFVPENLKGQRGRKPKQAAKPQK